MASNTYDLSVVMRVLDHATAPLARIGAKFKQLVPSIEKIDSRMQALGKSIQKVGAQMSHMGQQMSLKMTLPLTAMGVVATKAAIDFESAFTGVRKTVEATEPQFATLKKGLMGLATEIPLSTQEIFGIAEAAGQLGIKTNDIQSFTRVMADLGATTNMTAQDAATQLARFGNITGVAKKDFDRLGSSIVHLGNNTATTEAEIVGMGMRLAAAGDLVGMTAAEIMGFSAALTSIGINAEAGGTAFSQVMREIDKSIGSGSERMEGFAYVANLSVKDFETLWEKDAAGAILKFTEGLGKLDKAGVNVNQVLDDLKLDAVRISGALLGASLSGDLFREAIKMSSTAWEENIALTKEAELRYKTTASQLIIAKNRVMQMAASFGVILAKALLVVVDLLMPVVNWLAKLGPTGKTVIIIIAALAAAIGPLLVILGMLAASISAIMAIATPALLAVLIPIAAVVVAIGAIGAAILLVIRYWEELKQGFLKNPFAFIIDMISAVTWGLIPSFQAWKDLIVSIVHVFKNWKTLTVEFLTYMLDKISEILNLLPDFIKKRIGIGAEVKHSIGGALPSPVGAIGAVAGAQKSETDININVSSNEGATATVEKVKQKKGDSNVSIYTTGYVGAY
jgi:TP901 family phage tail tape measure protein